MEKLAYAAEIDPQGKDGRDEQRFKKLKAIVASLLPGLTAEDIYFRGPRIARRDPDQSGVHVRTPSGVTPLADL